MSNLEHVQELYDFLQGRMPEGYECMPPKLDADTAWTIVWFVQTSYRQYSDDIERCEVCGDLFDSENEGECLDLGDPPYSFCTNCVSSEEFEKKKAWMRG